MSWWADTSQLVAAVGAATAAIYAAIAARAARTQTAAAYPPFLEATRAIVYRPVDDVDDFSNVPDAGQDRRIKARIFVINHGADTATIVPYQFRNVRIERSADCYLYWSSDDMVPMHQAYDRFNVPDRWEPINWTNAKYLPQMKPGELLRFDPETEFPTNFAIREDGSWSHSLFILGHIQYDGTTGNRNGYFFCRRYDPILKQFDIDRRYELRTGPP